MENDYRYFPDPDIIPIEISEKDIVSLKARLPEVLDSRKSKLTSMGIKDSDAEILLANKELLDYFMAVIAITEDAEITINWVIQELLHRLKDNTQLKVNDVISVENFAQIIEFEKSGQITRTNARILLDETITTGKDSESLLKELNLTGEVNKKDIVDIVGMLINENPNILEDYKNNPTEVMNFFMGNIMKNTQGKARPEYVEPLVVEILKKHN